MRWLEFTKMHGAGNDFVVLDALAHEIPPLEKLAERIADRHLGVGCDQILVIRASEVADFRMDIYDADGSLVEMCGNGIRAVLKYLRDRGHTTAEEISVETLGGVVRPRWMGDDTVRVDMGQPVLAAAKIPTGLSAGDGPVLDVPLAVGGQTVSVSCVSMGNPHAVVYVDDPDAAPVTTLGPQIETHPEFPNRTNVEFVSIESRGRIRQRTWERGTGETLACGSGACAVGVASMLRGVVENQVEIVLRGGTLQIEWAGGDSHVFMTGPAAEVFTGRFPLPGAEVFTGRFPLED
ncbi:MAG: diaminopimelate epimerase [Deltaproteobacteria bacterium]|nr:diaminopimelate epimerase [Deltaproteobacteria bacterium]MBW2446816.1 diaminopimelate epimerase [Deltaproteobacteria bacterium]